MVIPYMCGSVRYLVVFRQVMFTDRSLLVCNIVRSCRNRNAWQTIKITAYGIVKCSSPKCFSTRLKYVYLFILNGNQTVYEFVHDKL